MNLIVYSRIFTSALSDAMNGIVRLPYPDVLSQESLQYKGIPDGKREIRKDVNRLFCDFNKTYRGR